MLSKTAPGAALSRKTPFMNLREGPRHRRLVAAPRRHLPKTQLLGEAGDSL